MSNLALRLIVFAVGIPALVIVALAFPALHYPVFAALVTAAAAMGAVETSQFFTAGPLGYPGRNVVIPLLGALLPAITFGFAHGFWSLDLVIAATVLSSAVILFVQVLRRDAGEFVDILPAVVAHIFILIYPGLFGSYAMRLVLFPDAGRVIVVFLMAVYLNDSFAYVTGRLFGRRPRRDEEVIVPISPNKSLAGFIGGMVASLTVIIVAGEVWPEQFGVSVALRTAFGLLIGGAAIVGDLAESALKRSSAIKDSGTIIPGRGGLLDSMDSPLFAAPVFYYAYRVFFLGI